MLSEALKSELIKANRVLVIIWLALLVSMVFLSVFAHIVAVSSGTPSSAVPDSPLAVVFPCIAVGLAILSFVFQKLLTTQSPNATSSVTGLNKTLASSLSDKNEQLIYTKHQSSYFVRNVIQFALFQAITMLGVVCTFATKDPNQIFPYAIASILLMFFRFPSEARAFDHATTIANSLIK